MATEVWKDIKEYKGLYQVSNFGRLKSLTKRSSLTDNSVVRRHI